MRSFCPSCSGTLTSSAAGAGNESGPGGGKGRMFPVLLESLGERWMDALESGRGGIDLLTTVVVYIL
jgi:hypothetical protein